MTSSYAQQRREQARRELAVTEVRARVAGSLVALLLATVLSVPLAEEWLRRRPAEGATERSTLSLAELPRALVEAARVARTDGLIAADLALLEAIDRTEERLEEESFLRRLLLPRVQSILLRFTGLGNEEVYPGRDGWLFYRADLDHLTGPGFLESRTLIERARSGDSWAAPPQPDPVQALLTLRDDLAGRGIELVVLPTPVKPSIHPEDFAGGSFGADPVQNRSYGEFVLRLRSAGVEVYDAAETLTAAPTGTGDTYLATDTHWTPAGLELVARSLSVRLEGNFDLGDREAVYFERPATVEGRGDLFTMLRLPEASTLVSPERVTLRTVTDEFGSSWRPSRDALVLVLGDSFTNVFSDPRLGWGAGAGLAERLAFHLQRPVDRIAQNAGGAHASREALAREPERLRNTRVVIYQFASRELSFGDWRLVGLD